MLLVGERDGPAIRGKTPASRGPDTKAVCIGRGEPGGIAGFEPGLRLRVRYRLARAAPLGFQLTDVTHARNYQAVIASPRTSARSPSRGTARRSACRSSNVKSDTSAHAAARAWAS